MTTFAGKTIPPLFTGVAALPFSGFFIGFGNVGWGGGDICIPHPDTQVGDFLFVGNTSSTLSGYTVLQAVPILTFTPFIRTATLTAQDNIASGIGGVIRQIYTVRSPGGGFTNAGFSVSSFNTPLQTTLPVPAQSAGAEDHAIIRYQGWRNLTTATSFAKGAVDMEVEGTRIATPFLAFVGYKFQTVSASVTQENTIYSVVESGTPMSNTFRHGINTV